MEALRELAAVLIVLEGAGLYLLVLQLVDCLCLPFACDWLPIFVREKQLEEAGEEATLVDKVIKVRLCYLILDKTSVD